MKQGTYKGKEYPKRKNENIDILPSSENGIYKIRFSDGFVLDYIFESEIEFNMS